MRKKLILLVVVLFAGIIGLQAQDYISVSGTITDKNSGNPIAGHEVIIQADSAYSSTLLTNEAGFYVDTVPSGGGLNFIYIFTIDNCTNLYHDTTINNPQAGAPILADFEICDDTTGGECQANFYYVVDSTGGGTTVSFVDQSNPAEGIDSWYWEFGDGTFSSAQNPVHTYNAPGTYNTCLTITALFNEDSCISTHCADINLVEMIPPAAGNGMISGHIFNQNAGGDDNPASDIQIMLKSGYGEYVGMIYSDEEGYFEFANLPVGAYTLFAEVMGKIMIPKTYDLSDENPLVDDVLMLIGESNVVFGIDEVNSRFVENISDIYPIRFPVPSGSMWK
ncbi:MAG: PKD domain-containing protein [Bacteroidota bacterium]|nr:PKD domain-containing protein [Bacteroidota bacterium]